MAKELKGQLKGRLKGKKIAIVMANEGVEQVELTEPWQALKDAGASVQLVAPRKGKIQAFNHLDKADKFSVDSTTGEIRADEYDAVMLPGGVANSDSIRTDESAIAFVQKMASAGKPVAAICHGPWALIDADVVQGRKLTSWPSLRTDVLNAGGNWVDQEVVVDRGLVTSRKPADIPAFNSKMIEEFAEGPH